AGRKQRPQDAASDEILAAAPAIGGKRLVWRLAKRQIVPDVAAPTALAENFQFVRSIHKALKEFRLAAPLLICPNGARQIPNQAGVEGKTCHVDREAPAFPMGAPVDNAPGPQNGAFDTSRAEQSHRHDADAAHLVKLA